VNSGRPKQACIGRGLAFGQSNFARLVGERGRAEPPSQLLQVVPGPCRGHLTGGGDGRSAQTTLGRAVNRRPRDRNLVVGAQAAQDPRFGWREWGRGAALVRQEKLRVQRSPSITGFGLQRESRSVRRLGPCYHMKRCHWCGSWGQRKGRARNSQSVTPLSSAYQASSSPVRRSLTRCNRARRNGVM
jgi:hypothetical protein